MNDWVYTDIVKDHFMHPRNVLSETENFQDNGKGIVGNIKCGDQMMVMIKVDPQTNTITDCRWKTYGCASAIASTSILSEMIKGMSLDAAYALSPKDIAKQLGSLPDHKIHCSVLGDKALRAAINDYYIRSGQKEKIKRDEARIICQCMNVTDHEIEDAVLEGARTYLQLQEKTKCGTVCGQCETETRKILEDAIAKYFPDYSEG